MNELILKLFTKACYHSDYEPENVPNAVVEKFAELIVQECLKIVEPDRTSGAILRWIESGCKQLGISSDKGW